MPVPVTSPARLTKTPFLFNNLFGHARRCLKQYEQYGRAGDDCRCTFYVDHTLEGKQAALAQHRDRKRAERRCAEAIKRGSWDLLPEPSVGKTIEEAISLMLAELDNAGRAKATKEKWQGLLKLDRSAPYSPTLDEYARQKGLTTLDEIQPEHMQEFRGLWHDEALAARKKPSDCAGSSEARAPSAFGEVVIGSASTSGDARGPKCSRIS